MGAERTRAGHGGATPLGADLRAIRERCTRDVSVDALYLDLAAKGINLGPSFKGCPIFGNETVGGSKDGDPRATFVE